MDAGAATPAWLLAQQLVRALDAGGTRTCAQHVLLVSPVRAEHAKALAYRLFTIADKRGWTAEALVYNGLVTSWNDISAEATKLRHVTGSQQSLGI